MPQTPHGEATRQWRQKWGPVVKAGAAGTTRDWKKLEGSPGQPSTETP